MAETLTARLALRHYGAGTDSFSRTEYNTDLVNKLEALTAIDDQGTFAARPVAGTRGFYYYATDNGIVYRDTGSAWTTVGGRGTDALFNNSGAGVVPLVSSAVSGQTANVFEAKVNNANVAFVTAGGEVNSSLGFIGKYTTLTGTDPAKVVADLKGAAAQSTFLMRIRDSGNVNMFSVGQTGALTGKFLQAGDGNAAIGIDTLTSPASMTLFTGTPALEVYGKKGGANTAFTEYLYLHHLAADASVVNRRIGMLMQIGDQAGDVTKSGAIYIESAVANAANPDLVLARGDAPVMRWKSTGEAQHLSTAGTEFFGPLGITPASGHALATGNTRMGTHQFGDDLYFRAAAANGFYFYAGGVHSTTPGDAGAGGTRLGQLLKSGSDGVWTSSRGFFTAGTGSANPASSPNPIVQVGPSASAKLLISHDRIQAANNAATADLFLNPHGGNTWIGASGTNVNLVGRPMIDGKRLTISASAPGSPSTGDIWIDI